MGKPIYCIDTEIISPLGFSVEENLRALRKGETALKKYDDPELSDKSFYAAQIEEGIINENFKSLGEGSAYTKLEKMLILAIKPLIDRSPQVDFENVRVIISTTKGNIDVLSKKSPFPKTRATLYELGRVLQRFFKWKQPPILLSNACISGGLALSVARHLMLENKEENSLIIGGDLVSRFTLSGFQSLHALDEKPCQPFSKDRNGINLGEAAVTMLLGRKKPKGQAVSLIGTASANDANHISGPSRTGEGLVLCIQNALKEAGIPSEKIDFISVHGTATRYNDEMEAIAFSRTNFQKTPLQSLKGVFGHTLGASALLESILTVHSLKNQELFPAVGFQKIGVSKTLIISKEHEKRALHFALKTASGFGGCNLALIFQLNN